MLEFIFGYVLGAESAKPSRPLTWRSVLAGFFVLNGLALLFWGIWKVLTVGEHAIDCGQGRYTQAWCEAASGIGSLLLFIGGVAGAVVVFSFVFSALKGHK